MKCFDQLETLTLHEFFDPEVKNIKKLKVLNILNLKNIKFLKKNICKTVTDLKFENCDLSGLHIEDILDGVLGIEQLIFKKCVLPTVAKKKADYFGKLKVLEIVGCKGKSGFDYFLGDIMPQLKNLEKLDLSNSYLYFKSLGKVLDNFDSIEFLSIKGHDLKNLKFSNQKEVNVCQCLEKGAEDLNFNGILVVEDFKREIYKKKFPKATLLFE